MKPETLEKLRNHTKEISDIMFIAQSSFKIFDYLFRPGTTEELEAISHNQFLKYSRDIYWRTYVIEMAKLFKNSGSDYFNLFHFIQKFKQGNEFEIKEIDKHSIAIWEANLRLEKKKIDNLIAQRDGLYGHTDKKRSHIQNELSFADAKELIQVVQRIVSEIYIAVFGEVIIFDVVGEPLPELRKIVDILVKQKEKILDFYSHHAIENNIDPKDVGI